MQVEKDFSSFFAKFLMIFQSSTASSECIILNYYQKWQKIGKKRKKSPLLKATSENLFLKTRSITNPGTSQIVTTIGWGQDSDSSSGISNVLREVDVPIMDNSACDAVYGNVNDGHICIDSTGGKGTCSVCNIITYKL